MINQRDCAISSFNFSFLFFLQAAKYFDIEMREADVSPDSLVLTPERARPLIDEHTIGVW